MRRILFSLCLMILLPLVAQAYTLVLKDGRRFEVREQYRIVSDIAVFSLADGSRFSISLDKINISATEMANGLDAGAFAQNATNPPKVTEQKADPNNQNATQTTPTTDDSPLMASNRPTAKKLTNSDFERYRVRREEANRAAADRAAAKAAAQIGAQSTGLVPAPLPTTTSAAPATPQSEAEARENAILAQRRENEKRKEEYWRGRSRALLTQMRVQQEQIAVLQAQIEESRRLPQAPQSTVSVYNTQPGYSPYGGIRIGGVPIGIGGVGNSTGGGSVVVVNNQNQDQRGRTMQERLSDLQLQYQATLVQYDEMCEEARRDGALPGWLR